MRQPRLADAPVLPALRTPLDAAVALEHVQDAVGTVEAWVFGFELFVHAVVGGDVEVVDVGRVDRGAGEADETAGAEGDDGVAGGGEAEVAFH